MVDWKKVFSCMGMSPSDYIKRFVVPVMLLGLAFPIIIQIAAPAIMTGMIRLVLYGVPFFLLLVVVMYPINILELKKGQIDNNIHYYVTHMGVLSTSQMQAVDMLHHLSKNQAYEYLARETEKIYVLMEDWNISFAQACRFIARRTPSDIFSDFLDRFAYAVDSGENVEEFLTREQKVVMNDFDTMYKDALHAIDNIKDIYVSMVMALIFIVAFAILLPVIMGIDSTLLMVGSIFMFVGTEALLVYFAKMRVPKDRIWHTLDIETSSDRAIRTSFPLSILICMIIAVPVMIWSQLPVTIEIALIMTPMALTGRVAAREETKIKRQDDNFASFIRSLGASSGARGGLITESLRQLIYHDFGPLTKNVRELHKRLNTRINKMRSWEFFAAGTGSNLIERFGTIFAEGTHLGGKPEVIGNIIGDNVMEINSLRKLRYSSASSLVGMLYGLTAGIAFTMFLSLVIVGMLGKIFAKASLPEGMDIGISLAAATSMNIGLMTFLLMAMLVGHSFVSSVLIRVVDGGHMFNVYTHFVGMLWISAICAEATIRLAGPMIQMNF
ncbi:MAG: archaellar assembly protein FlaJ [Candidatus Methanoperedens sp.]|nr:archaellar assembly protein FlaJ [Candidatus Methanoperedens sp.]MCE8425505.1 archaellar assembly protein FlaJ [Candidatus Methanoperedens sp.]MCE8428640.1 archaellar assembly protein FlaJ [Candidatus Methanoperedens sp.]